MVHQQRGVAIRNVSSETESMVGPFTCRLITCYRGVVVYPIGVISAAG